MIHARTDYNRIQDPAKKIHDDEPVFLLRAQDVTAAACLRHWIRLNKALITSDKKKGVEISTGRRKAIVLAEAHAYKMEEWPIKKTSDVP